MKSLEVAHTTENILNHINDWDAFSALSKACQSDILTKLSSIQQINNCPSGQRGATLKAISESRKVGKATLYNELNRFKSGGWRGLINKSRFPKYSGSMPQACKKAVIAEFEDQSRDEDAAEVRRTKLSDLHLWRKTGDSTYRIPGYTSPPEDDPRYGHPRGWSLKSFERLKLKGYQKALSKQGAKAASKFLPSVLTTRKGMHFLERVYFDDQDYDNKIVVSGLPQSVRPVGFNSLDHYTGAHLGYHLRVVTKTTDEQTYKALTGKEFTWFALHQLQTIGYRTDEARTTYIFEHGTANTYNNKKLSTFSGHCSFEEAVAALTNNQVTIERSGKFNEPAFKGMFFRPQSCGNFKFKTWIESSFKLVRSYMQALPGAMGRKYELAPEELYGVELYEKQLLKCMSHMPPAIIDKMQHHMLTYVEFADILEAVYHAINHRTDHNLEAWKECGFTTPIWRLSEDSNHWMPRKELEDIKDEEERNYLLRKVATNPKLIKEVNMSPAAAVQELRKDPAITTLPRSTTPLLIPKEWAILKKVKSNNVIKIQDPFHNKTYHQYVTLLNTKHGSLMLKPEQEILCYYNPFDIDNLVICSTDGAYLGTLTRSIPRSSHNTQQTLDQLGARAEMKAHLETEPRSRAANIMKDRTEMRQHNDRLKAGDLSTAEERRSVAGKKAAQTKTENNITKKKSRTGMTREDLT